MKETPRCPVLLVSGFLGSGKTSFLKRFTAAGRAAGLPLLRQDPAHPLMLIENDFGDVSFDAQLLREARIDVREMTQGCICCSLSGSFSRSLKDISRRFSPSLLMIEPSGLGRPSDIISVFQEPELKSRYRLLPPLTIVDLRHTRKYLLNFKDFYEDQLRCASSLLLNRSGEMPAGQREEACRLIAEAAPSAGQILCDVEGIRAEELLQLLLRLIPELQEEPAYPLEEAPPPSDTALKKPAVKEEKADGRAVHSSAGRRSAGGLLGRLLHKRREEQRAALTPAREEHGSAHAHGSAGESFAALSLDLPEALSEQALQHLIRALDTRFEGALVRAKGFIRLDGRPFSFQYLPGEWTCQPSAAAAEGPSRIAFIFAGTAPRDFRAAAQELLKEEARHD